MKTNNNRLESILNYLEAKGHKCDTAGPTIIGILEGPTGQEKERCNWASTTCSKCGTPTMELIIGKKRAA